MLTALAMKLILTHHDAPIVTCLFRAIAVFSLHNFPNIDTLNLMLTFPSQLLEAL